MNDNLILMGINAPRKHQAVIAQLVYGLTQRYKDKISPLFPYPETMIDEGQTSPVPDVMLVDMESDITKVIIDLSLVKNLVKKNNFIRGKKI